MHGPVLRVLPDFSPLPAAAERRQAGQQLRRPGSVGGGAVPCASWIVRSLGLVAVVTLALAACSATTDGRPVAGNARPSPSPMTKTVTASPTAQATIDFATIYAHEQSGVVRIETLSCSAAGIGTGFLLSPTLVATVNHVINQSVVVSLIDGTQRTTGTVIGSDPAQDLALVRASRPLTGFHFGFAAAPPSIGDQVAAIGFPIGDPITLTHGDVSGLDRHVTVNGLPVPLAGMIETDAAINPGNSGGPLLNQQGTVVGLIDALDTTANGIAYAVPSSQASAADKQWQLTLPRWRQPAALTRSARPRPNPTSRTRRRGRSQTVRQLASSPRSTPTSAESTPATTARPTPS
jgi:S1-C subfamily serine protease